MAYVSTTIKLNFSGIVISSIGVSRFLVDNFVLQQLFCILLVIRWFPLTSNATVNILALCFCLVYLQYGSRLFTVSELCCNKVFEMTAQWLSKMHCLFNIILIVVAAVIILIVVIIRIIILSLVNYDTFWLVRSLHKSQLTF